jgi:hypothetical protein
MQLLAMTLWTNLEAVVIPYEHKPRILLFSVANSAMNHPRLWDLRKEFLTDIGNCTKSVLPTLGATQRIGTSANIQRQLGSSVEPLKKPTDENAAYPYGAMDFHSRINNLFPNGQHCTRWPCNFKGL